MKRVFVILSILAFLFTIILTQTSAESSTNAPPNAEVTNLPKIDVRGTAQNIDAKFDQEIQIPNSIRPLISILFGIKSNISLSTLIIMLALLLGLFTIIQSMMGGFFETKKTTGFILSIILTFLASMVGVVRIISTYLLDLGDKIKFIEKWTAGSIILAIILIMLISSIWKRISRYMQKKKKERRDKEKTEEAEKEISEGLEILKQTAEIAKKQTGKNRKK